MGFQDILFVPSKESSNDAIKNIKRSLITSSEEHKVAITIENLITLAQNGFFKEKCHIHEFLENCEIQLVRTPDKPRNPELEARVQKLKAEQENEEYRKMTKGLGNMQEKPKATIRNDVRQVTSQITAVINFVLTVGGSFFFAFKAVEYALPEKNIPAQVMMGIITSTVVALADLYFLVRTI